jgi:hypothetical protein
MLQLLLLPHLLSITSKISNTTSSSRLQEKANVKDHSICSRRNSKQTGVSRTAAAAGCRLTLHDRECLLSVLVKLA